MSGGLNLVGENNGADRPRRKEADVSITLPKIPYGGVSPVRLQGRDVRHGLPDYTPWRNFGLPLPFVRSAFNDRVPAQCRGRRAPTYHRLNNYRCSAPGALATVRVVLSQSIIA